MNKTEIVSKATKTVNKVWFVIKKYSPEIMMAAGVAGTVVSGVMACKATLKATEILDEAKTNIDTIHEVVNSEKPSFKTYTEEDMKKDLAIVYTQTGVKLLKVYGPALVLGTLSITSMVTSNNILRKRNVALAAAYSAVDKSFKEYRKGVIDRFGAEVDRQIKYNLKAVEVEETVTDEKGKEKKVKKTIETAGPDLYSPYAKIFDVGNPYWEKDPELNLFFIKSRQAQANDKLKADGFLFLNEVYEMLGFDKTKAGQMVGWIYDPENGDGDNYVDFGLYDVFTVPPTEAERKTAFVNGYERSIILDFNVDGNIWEQM